MPPIGAAGADLGAFGLGDRAHAAARRRHQGAFDRHRHALVLQGRDQGFAGAELGNRFGHVQGRIRHE
ncbi:hypothetical protein CATMIT_01944, partial [Catenibacterium mitsuokai DSM 15897]